MKIWYKTIDGRSKLRWTTQATVESIDRVERGILQLEERLERARKLAEDIRTYGRGRNWFGRMYLKNWDREFEEVFGAPTNAEPEEKGNGE